MKLRITSAIFGIAIYSICSATSPDFLPANRIGYWQTAGVDGGIPSVTTIHANIPAGSTAAQINSAISTCESNEVVLLGSGTFNLTGPIYIEGRHGVVLRGQGRSTLLNFTGSGGWGLIGVKSGHIWQINTTPPPHIANWVSGFTRGTTNIVLSHTTGLLVGDVFCLDQLNDTNADVFAVVPFLYEGPGMSRENNTRNQQHMAIVKAINGTTVTFWPPLHMEQWSSTRSPQAWWSHSLATSPTLSYIHKVGIEDLAINGTYAVGDGSYGSTIAFWWAANCWVTNVYITNEFGGSTYTTHVLGLWSDALTVKNSTFYGTRTAMSMSYGILLYGVHNSLVEDNIFVKVCGPIVLGACAAGNVIAYNYSTNNYYLTYYTPPDTYTMSSSTTHDAHNCMNLIEGNWGTTARADNFHGSSSHNVIFRNRWVGPEMTFRNQGTFPIWIDCFNRHYSVVANILGRSGWHTGYEAYPGGSSGVGPYYIYKIGLSEKPQPTPEYPWITPSDMATYTTLYRHGNYDSYNNAIVWNSTNSNHEIPNSYYLTEKPSWFGDRQWPPFDPANGASMVNYASLYFTNIPAGYRAYYLTDTPVAEFSVATPVFTPAAGAHEYAQSVVISCSTPGSVIYWNTNGTPATTNTPANTLYTAPIGIVTDRTLSAIATVPLTGTNSSVRTGIYTITGPNLPTPTFTVSTTPTYTNGVYVVLTCATNTAAIYYTTDGTTPTAGSTLYPGGGGYFLAATATNKAIAILAGHNDSPVATAIYTITNTLTSVGVPTFNEAPGTWTNSVSVGMQVIPTNASIFYTTNGTTPTTNSDVWNWPITLTSTRTINAFGWFLGYDQTNWLQSAVTSGTYTIVAPPLSPSTVGTGRVSTLNRTNWYP